ncbi:MAG: hypothetical protein HRU20_28845 [Pseudomonadales bacterium]|nr:hypothetical protein [Pseudomonadales bacterium]
MSTALTQTDTKIIWDFFKKMDETKQPGTSITVENIAYIGCHFSITNDEDKTLATIKTLRVLLNTLNLYNTKTAENRLITLIKINPVELMRALHAHCEVINAFRVAE